MDAESRIWRPAVRFPLALDAHYPAMDAFEPGNDEPVEIYTVQVKPHSLIQKYVLQGNVIQEQVKARHHELCNGVAVNPKDGSIVVTHLRASMTTVYNRDMSYRLTLNCYGHGNITCAAVSHSGEFIAVQATSVSVFSAADGSLVHRFLTVMDHVGAAYLAPGIAFDADDNLVVSTPGAVKVISRRGEPLESIPEPRVATERRAAAALAKAQITAPPPALPGLIGGVCAESDSGDLLHGLRDMNQLAGVGFVAGGGPPPERLASPGALCAGSNGHIYISSSQTRGVLVYTRAGRFLYTIHMDSAIRDLTLLSDHRLLVVTCSPTACLMLFHTWATAWTPERHVYAPPVFRQAARTLLWMRCFGGRFADAAVTQTDGVEMTTGLAGEIATEANAATNGGLRLAHWWHDLPIELMHVLLLALHQVMGRL